MHAASGRFRRRHWPRAVHFLEKTMVVQIMMARLSKNRALSMAERGEPSWSPFPVVWLPRIPFLLPILFCLFAATGFAEGPLLVRYLKQPDSETRDTYPVQLMEMVLKKSGGTCQLVPVATEMLQGRAFKQVEAGETLDIVWGMTSIEREKTLLPIRIPIDKGLYGIRMLLVHKDNSDTFRNVKTIDDLKPFQAGQGHDWPDFTILTSNGLPVTGNPSYEGLFLSLEHKRIDYFPRSAEEIAAEAETHKDHSIVIEPHLILHYPTAQYFFVNKKNAVLADLLIKGFERAIQDGSFERLFRQQNQKILKTLKGRRVIELNNPILPPGTPLNRKELWFELK